MFYPVINSVIITGWIEHMNATYEKATSGKLMITETPEVCIFSRLDVTDQYHWLMI